MTSANVTKYRITRNGEEVGGHYQSHLCKPKWEELLKFVPLEEHQITPHGEDEHEAPWEGDPENLLDFVIRCRPCPIPGVPRFLRCILVKDKETGGWNAFGGFVDIDQPLLDSVAKTRFGEGSYRIASTVVGLHQFKPKLPSIYEQGSDHQDIAGQSASPNPPE